jgi:glutathione S-transferase
MTDIILHHYAISVFSERVRLAFGLKGLTWNSVTIPHMMPKPDLMPLTGGYRRTPVMQIGADVYCDTLLILRKIEVLHPDPSLYPEGSKGLSTALAWWVDKSLFWNALGVLADTLGPKIPPDFVAERRAFGFPLGPEDVKPVLHRHLQQGAAHLATLADMLGDGRPFLLGDAVSVADLAAYSTFWVLSTQGGEEAVARLPYDRLRSWTGRVAALGHGTPVEMSAEEALQIARDSRPDEISDIGDNDLSGLKVGTVVSVRADDTGRDAVRGKLLTANAQEIVIRSEHPRVGEVNIHFPRAGFDVTAVEGG